MTKINSKLFPRKSSELARHPCMLYSIYQCSRSYRKNEVFENRKMLNSTQERSGKVFLPPLYLPIGLQSILEIKPRTKALILFSRYMDICPSHIYNAIACGLNDNSISYLYRLLSGLQYDAMPHESMVFCWTKLVAFQDKVNRGSLFFYFQKHTQNATSAVISEKI